jgi:hypothetical protein
MADMKVRVSINNQNRDNIRTVGVGPVTGATRLSQLSDVNIANPQNNHALIYDSATGKFVSKEIPVLNGGNF